VILVRVWTKGRSFLAERCCAAMTIANADIPSRPETRVIRIPDTHNCEVREAQFQALEDGSLRRRLEAEEPNLPAFEKLSAHEPAAVIPWTGRQMVVAKPTTPNHHPHPDSGPYLRNHHRHQSPRCPFNPNLGGRGLETADPHRWQLLRRLWAAATTESDHRAAADQYDQRMPEFQVSAQRAGAEGTGSVSERMRILDATAKVLSLKGFAGTQLTDVSDSAHLMTTTIYKHFRSREELFEEVMYRGVIDIRKHMEEALGALPPDTSPMDRIMVAVEAHLRTVLELTEYTTAWIRNSGQLPEQLSRRQKKGEVAYGQIWKSLFADAIAGGEINPELDAGIAQFLVLGALNWIVTWWDPRRGSADALVANAQLMIRNGLTSTTRSSASSDANVGQPPPSGRQWSFRRGIRRRR
jgi:TetR/AcrR family transcriptional regulator, cholesterol catabolism regulator